MSRRKARILYIYDRLHGQLARKDWLEQSGYEVLEATGGPEGVYLFASNPVDAVVLDYQVHGKSSALVASQIKHINSQVPIVLLSNYEPPSEPRQGSVDTFLSKSQSSKILLSTLQQLLEGRSRPFFHRWLDNWKVRNQGASQ